jgi:hypothetical protein
MRRRTLLVALAGLAAVVAAAMSVYTARAALWANPLVR